MYESPDPIYRIHISPFDADLLRCTVYSTPSNTDLRQTCAAQFDYVDAGGRRRSSCHRCQLDSIDAGLAVFVLIHGRGVSTDRGEGGVPKLVVGDAKETNWIF